MLVEAGHFALALALGLSLIQLVVPLWGARANDPVLMAVAPTTALAVLACVGIVVWRRNLLLGLVVAVAIVVVARATGLAGLPPT